MTAERDFWDWFIRHEPELYDFDPDVTAEREQLFDELASELQKVDPNLTFEFGPNAATREFVISADGIKRAFSAVVSLSKAAPSLHRWKVTAFRPRRAPNIVELGGKRIDPKDVQFSLLDNGKKAGIYLFLPGFHESDSDVKRIAYLMLDEALGEYDVESRLGLIKMFPPDTPNNYERHPLLELPKLFDQLIARLEGMSGKSS